MMEKSLEEDGRTGGRATPALALADSNFLKKKSATDSERRGGQFWLPSSLHQFLYRVVVFHLTHVIFYREVQLDITPENEVFYMLSG